jgi:hypothetical protein
VMRCIYCGTRDNLNRDHVPPKAILRKPYPSNLATVPSCMTCNENYSKDEEYFRLVIIGLLCHSEESEGLFDGPMARSMDRNNKLEDLMFNSLQVIGGRVALDVEYPRVFRIAEKIVRGMEFIENGNILPFNQKFKVSFHEVINEDSGNGKYGPDFTYGVSKEVQTIWEFTLYSSARFIVKVA